MGRRQQQQEAAKRAYEANYGKAPPAEPPSRGLHWIWIVLFVAAGIGGGIAWYFLKDRLHSSSMLGQRGTAKGSLVVGARLVLIDAVSVDDDDRSDSNGNSTTVTISKTRVTVFDATTGKEAARVLIEGLDACARATDDRMWCAFDDGLRIYGLPDMRELLVARKAISTAVVPGIWFVDKGTAYQLLADGWAARIDAATLAVTRIDDVPKALQPDITGRRHPGDLSMFETSCDPQMLHGRGMMNTARDRWTRDGDHLVKGKVKTPTLLDPEMIGEDLVIHSSSLDPSATSLRLSRVRPDGSLAWTAELGAPTCDNAVVAGSTYVVTTKSADPRALAIDLESGAIKWRLP